MSHHPTYIRELTLIEFGFQACRSMQTLAHTAGRRDGLDLRFTRMSLDALKVPSRENRRLVGKISSPTANVRACLKIGRRAAMITLDAPEGHGSLR